jgi:hypothetical protein
MSTENYLGLILLKYPQILLNLFDTWSENITRIITVYAFILLYVFKQDQRYDKESMNSQSQSFGSRLNVEI